ncbi:ankyrin repeat-containing domain protein, partial [Cercophora newfieldiana]
DAEVYITNACVTYLSFDDFERGFCPTDATFETRLSEYPLDENGRTPLSLAAENGFFPIAAALLEASNIITLDFEAQKDNDGLLPLSWAARNGHIEVIKMLLAHSNLERGDANNPLLWAILRDDLAAVELILKAGLETAATGWTDKVAPKALCLAADLGKVPMFTCLLQNLSADVNCRGDKGMTPLMKAALQGRHEMVEELIRLNADPGLKDDQGRTAFSLAAAYGQDNIVSLLLARVRSKIDLDGKEKSGRTPLSLAAGNGHEGIVQMLLQLEGEVDVDSRDASGQTPLFWAARDGH